MLHVTASQGTIIHPSVYMIMDRPVNMSLDPHKFPYANQLRTWEADMLGTKDEIGADDEIQIGFWMDSEAAIESTGPARILVCGNTGVGKSTLINKVFAVEGDAQCPTKICTAFIFWNSGKLIITGWLAVPGAFTTSRTN